MINVAALAIVALAGIFDAQVTGHHTWLFCAFGTATVFASSAAAVMAIWNGQQ